MIRPAVITDEISQDFEWSLDVMLEYGVRDAELRSLWGTSVMELTPEEQRRAKTALNDRGMRSCGIASPIYKTNLFPTGTLGSGGTRTVDESALDRQIMLLERAIQLCEYFNTKLIRIFAFWKQRPASAEVQREIVSALRPAVRRAEQAGVVLGLENEHACMLGTGEETAAVIRELNSPNLRAIWDPGNAFFAGEVPFPTGYRAIREYVAHVHVKDAEIGPGGEPRWAPIGEGEIDLESQIAALWSDGYEGILSLETHYTPVSGDREEGSRQCLEGLTRLLRQTGAWETSLV